MTCESSEALLLRALSELGPGPHHVHQVTAQLATLLADRDPDVVRVNKWLRKLEWDGRVARVGGWRDGMWQRKEP